MRSKRVIILGGGISGLSLAYFLKTSILGADVTVIEKNKRVGGKFGTDISTGFMFEKGPCLFKMARGTALSQLFQQLGLEREMVVAEPPYLNRYFSWKGKTRKLSLFSWDVWSLFFKEKAVATKMEDESVYDFAARRFSPQVAEKYFTPMVCGYNGGDLRKLSVASYLPELKEAERRCGSILKAYLKQKLCIKNRCWQDSKWVYFPQGSHRVIQALSDILVGHILTEREVLGVSYRDGIFSVETSEGVLEGDILCSALPGPVIGKLWVPELSSVPHRSIISVGLGYRKKVLSKGGFGYFFPAQNEEEALMARFDSELLVQQNQVEQETRLTVLIKRNNFSKEKAIELAVKAVKRGLHIHDIPFRAEVSIFDEGFPLMEVGHEPRMRALEGLLSTRYPNFYLLGNYFEGALVHHCVERAQNIAKKIANKLAI